MRYQLYYEFSRLFLLCFVYKFYPSYPRATPKVRINFRGRELLKGRFQLCLEYFGWTKFYYTMWCQYNKNKSYTGLTKWCGFMRFMDNSSKKSFFKYFTRFRTELNFSFTYICIKIYKDIKRKIRKRKRKIYKELHTHTHK